MTRRQTKKKTDETNLVRLNRIDLAIDMSTSGVREALVSLRDAAASGGHGTTQLRIDARDLNAVHVYLPARQLKLVVARLEALSLGAAGK